MQITISPELPFAKAAEAWLASRDFQGSARARYVSPRTLASYTCYITALNRFFGELPLNEIEGFHLHEYQRLRAAGKLPPPPRLRLDGSVYPAGGHKSGQVGPNKINQEIGTLQMIMRRAGCWSVALADSYEPLTREQGDIPKSLSPLEQQLWLDTSASRREWRLVYLYSLVAFRSTAHNQEMRGIRLMDLLLGSQAVNIQAHHAKNKYRIRTAPLYDDGTAAMRELVELARARDAREPQHFLFPFRVAPNVWDPARPMGNQGLKRAWDEVREATGLRWFTPHDTRHAAITRYMECGVPITTVMAWAGHISQKMTLHYTHICEHAKRAAAAAAARGEMYAFASAPFGTQPAIAHYASPAIGATAKMPASAAVPLAGAHFHRMTY